MIAMNHQKFTTTTRGLQRESPVMRLYEKAKRFGVWNPSEIDLSQDQNEWLNLTTDEQDLLLRLAALFQAGEEAVTLDLLPLIMVIASEGHLEEELYLTTFLWEEAKHTDFFNHFLTEVTRFNGDLNHYHSENYKTIFYEALPTALQSLLADPSPSAQLRASVTYNMIVEGVLAETGYYAFLTTLESRNILPGTCQAITLLKQDESRHIAYGLYLISRLLAADNKGWQVLENTMNELFIPALGVISDAFAAYEVVPFGLDEMAFIDYASAQFQKRLARLEHARDSASLEVDQSLRHEIDEHWS